MSLCRTGEREARAGWTCSYLPALPAGDGGREQVLPGDHHANTADPPPLLLMWPLPGGLQYWAGISASRELLSGSTQMFTLQSEIVFLSSSLCKHVYKSEDRSK